MIVDGVGLNENVLMEEGDGWLGMGIKGFGEGGCGVEFRGIVNVVWLGIGVKVLGGKGFVKRGIGKSVGLREEIEGVLGKMNGIVRGMGVWGWEGWIEG
ncbi:hypothetical protein [Siminovitchia fortis]|uniref:hypothetical protein n=1 Tax=Siminovitchia fortis TaxID=254758 RepID=UPI0011A75C2D|nr:hypothetical protein [Siminovitchia fortis]